MPQKELYLLQFKLAWYLQSLIVLLGSQPQPVSTLRTP